MSEPELDCLAAASRRAISYRVASAVALSAKSRFVAPWQRAGEGPLQWTLSELALFLEGSEIVGRMALSPPPWRAEDRQIVFR